MTGVGTGPREEQPPIRTTLQQFYDDDRRRRSAEVPFGFEWTSAEDPHTTYGLYWIRRTKEMYLLRAPQYPLDIRYPTPSPTVAFAEAAYWVILLGKAPTQHALAAAIRGWEEQMHEPDSLRWLREHLREAPALDCYDET